MSKTVIISVVRNKVRKINANFKPYGLPMNYGALINPAYEEWEGALVIEERVNILFSKLENGNISKKEKRELARLMRR